METQSLKDSFWPVVSGNAHAILTGERTALNYLQRMSGIATYTNQVVSLLEGSSIRLLDTRKDDSEYADF